MISLAAYKWLGKDVVLPDGADDEQLSLMLSTLDREVMPAYQKETHARHYINQLTADKPVKSGKTPAEIRKYFRSCTSGNAYQKCLQQVLQSDHTKYMMCGLTIIMAGTICIYFLRAVITGSFVINFNIDAIIASVAAAFLMINSNKKYAVLNRYGRNGYYASMDAISFLLCILLKFAIPAMFDCSVIVLFIAYMIEKKQFEKSVREKQ